MTRARRHAKALATAGVLLFAVITYARSLYVWDHAHDHRAPWSHP